MDGAFAAALIGFLGMHWQLLAHGCTTIGEPAQFGPLEPTGKETGRDAGDALLAAAAWLLTP
jgi:hypothetical protein